ncbi:MAG TPA: hypothetical protein DEB40_00255 [Elusimicrobia bacterium]|nr:hypothetical protein [Elusimicrobiota bacterium]HBT60164.1 hypothetical protein [Elusimicrobiota bacterium]
MSDKILLALLLGVLPAAASSGDGVPLAAAEKPRIAVVIDDFGLNYATTPKDEAWMAIGFPITFAVMPESPRTKAAAQAVKSAGHELIIHFPFDPFLSLDLPKDRVSGSDLDKVRKLLAKCFRDIPGPAGINTHRSYKATMNRPLMAAFMAEIKPQGVYFLDSKAAPKSAAYDEARKAGLRWAANDFFLEEPGHYNDAAFCAKMLRRAAALARKRGSAMAIGHHYYRGTLQCVETEVPKLQAEGFEFVFASALLK